MIRDLFLNCNSLAQDGVYCFDASGVYCTRVTVRLALRNSFRFDGTTTSSSSNQECIDCYSNGAVTAGYHVKSIYAKLKGAISDGGQYGAYIDGSNVYIDGGCHFEGASITCLHTTSNAGGARIAARAVSSVASANGIVVNAASKIVAANVAGLTGTAGTNGTGISVNAGPSVVSSNTVSGFDLQIVGGVGASTVTIGSNALDSGVQEGIHIDMTGTALVSGNTVSNVAASLTVASGATILGGPNYFSGTVASSARPVGYRFTYDELTSNVVVSATTEAAATTVKTATAVTFDGLTTVRVEFFAPYVDVAANAGGNNVRFVLYDGSSSIGLLGLSGSGQTAVLDGPVMLGRELTPSAAAHTYSVRAFRTNANSTVTGGAGASGNDVPGYIKITKVV